MHDPKTYSPAGALFALTMLAVLQIPTDGRPSDTQEDFNGPVVNQLDARPVPHSALPVGQPARLARPQPASWVF